MPRYANVDKLMEHAIKMDWSSLKWVNEVDICTAINPNVVTRKRGKWKVCNILDYAQRHTGRMVGKCPFCGYLTDEFRKMFESHHMLTNFCPNCGAEMERSEDA